jgi:hypothetical protein
LPPKISLLPDVAGQLAGFMRADDLSQPVPGPATGQPEPGDPGIEEPGDPDDEKLRGPEEPKPGGFRPFR